MRRFLILIAMLSCSPLVSAAELRDLRLWDSPNSTRVVFDLNGAVEHKVFTLSNPDRVVVDISGLDRSSAATLIAKAAVKGVVSKLRSGPRDDGATRIVLEVSRPVDPKSFSIQPNGGYGYRLVVDLNEPAQQAAATPAAESTAPAPAAVSATAPVPAVQTPAVPASAMRVADKPIVVAIDAGHGGEDPGARGKSGLLEKDVSLAIARRLAKLVNEQPGMKAVLTRDGDYYVGLRERVQKARQVQADLFVSIHCNALNRSDMHGTAVYVLSSRGATNENARWLANQENSADLVGGIEIQDKDHELAAVLIDLSQSATMEASFDLGNRMLGSLGEINKLQKPKVQQAGFVVLKAPDIPSVLVETAFITNPREEKLLASEAYQQKLADSMLSGIKGYFQSYRPQQQVVVNEPAPPPKAETTLRKGRTVEVNMERKLGGGAATASSGLAR
jgi:N-acetylmuramoyl-L-alanine amidase